MTGNAPAASRTALTAVIPVTKPVCETPAHRDDVESADFPALAEVLRRMEAAGLAVRERRDPRRFFHSTYLRATLAVRAELADGGFLDAAWVERWGVAFATLYLDALEASLHGREVPRPWAAAFAADDTLAPQRHVLLGMNAHINYDLPQAMLAVISEADFKDPALLACREADHRHIDQVLASLTGASKRLTQIAGRSRGMTFRLADRANRAATRRCLAEARGKVWANAGILARARRDGVASYRALLAELERLAIQRVADLTRPGPVLIRLGVGGFGITLPPRVESHHAAKVGRRRGDDHGN
jgi:hypothetical protein